MRLKACLGLVLLGSSACTHVPETLRVELGGSTLEFRKKPVPEVETPEAPETPAAEAPSADAPRR